MVATFTSSVLLLFPPTLLATSHLLIYHCNTVVKPIVFSVLLCPSETRKQQVLVAPKGRSFLDPSHLFLFHHQPAKSLLSCHHRSSHRMCTLKALRDCLSLSLSRVSCVIFHHTPFSATKLLGCPADHSKGICLTGSYWISRTVQATLVVGFFGRESILSFTLTYLPERSISVPGEGYQ